MSALQIITAGAALVAAIGSCCSPLMIAFTELLIFGGMRALRDYLQPAAVAGAVTKDSKMTCRFESPEGSIV